jgi:hypothetical protein
VPRISTLLPLLALLLCAPALGAQTLNGVLRDEESRAPVARAMIVLLDAEGKALGQTQTRANGSFTLVAPGPGTYRVRAEHVGRAATLSEPVTLAAGEQKPFEMLARGQAVRLEGLVAQAGERQCRMRDDATGRVATVWEEARKALAAAEWTRRNEPRDFNVRRYSREMDAASLTVRKEQAQTGRTRQITPFRALSAEQLAEGGYVRKEGREFVYFAPDAEVLLSDPFLDTHCFTLQRDEQNPGLVGLAFEPGRGRRLPDVTGVLWLDEKTAELRHVDYEYTRVEVGEGNDRRDWGARTQVERHKWGGRIEFDRMPDGVWFVRRWSIRMPVTGTMVPEGGNLRSQGNLGLVAVKEDGAEVMGLRTMQGQVVIADQPAGGAAVRGMVYDSTRARGLPQATVFLVGTEYVAQTDSTGAFRLQGVPDGRYAIAFSHPRADSLVYIPTPIEVDLARGREESVHLSLGRPGRVAAAAESGDSAIALASVLASAVRSTRLQMAGFYDRQRVGTGVFMNESVFMRRNGARVLDRIIGVRSTYARVVEEAATSAGPSVSGWVLYQYRAGRRCVAHLWIDGMRHEVKQLDRIKAEDVLAVEVYSGDEVPMRFVQHTADPGNTVCGAVVVWLKTPAT